MRPNQTLETNCRPASPLDAWRQLGCAIHARPSVSGGSRHRQEHITGGIYPHDPSAVVYLIEPGIFRTKRGPLRMVCEGMAIGQTIMAAYDYQFQQPPWKDQPMVTAAVTIDPNRFQDAIERLLIGDRR